MLNVKTRLLPREAAEHIGCRYDKLLQMVRLGQVPHYRIGRRVLFTRETLDTWIKEQEQRSIHNG